ncbi:DUF6232 family protein [Streptomyces tubercidicus]|uniref:DUF6232 family protein n=1 Tax=Streptomyces tubercidicus TaxID=47759 RepID=UPI0034679294
MTSTDPVEPSWNTSAQAQDAAGSPPPTAPPPPPAAPPQPPASPPTAADPHPDVAPPTVARPVIGVELRVSKRLLWIDDAYYPLQNVARVYTLTIHPRRNDAVVLFVKRLLLLGLAIVLLVLLSAIGGGFRSSDSDSDGLTALVVIAAGAALVYSLVEMLKVLSAAAHFVLAVETTGSSTAVVTSPDRDRLRQLAHQIAHAIENPEAEFVVRVNTVSVSPRHYYFGDNVNMYGGTGNVGMAS